MSDVVVANAWVPQSVDDLVGKNVGTATSTSAATDGEWVGEVRCTCGWVSGQHATAERAWDEFVGHAWRQHPVPAETGGAR